MLAVLAVLAIGAAPAWAQPRPAGGGEVYSCVDKNGRRITSDRPIVACLDREQRVLDDMGTERRRIGPSLTEHERAAQEAKRREEAQERARVADARRRERVLLARYPDEASHNEERQSALTQIDEVIAVAQRRIAELRTDRKKLTAELEFYKGDLTKAPMVLQRQFAENDESSAEQQRFIVKQEQEKQRVNQRFDAELAELRRLWAQQRAAAAKWATPPPAPAADSSR